MKFGRKPGGNRFICSNRRDSGLWIKQAAQAYNWVLLWQLGITLATGYYSGIQRSQPNRIFYRPSGQIARHSIAVWQVAR